MSFFKNLKKNLGKHFRIVGQEEDTFSQRWSYRVSKFKLILIAVILTILISFLSVLTYEKLVIGEGGLSVETEQNVLLNNKRVDSLIRVIKIRDYYLKDLQKVMKGDKFPDSNLHLNKPISLGDSIVFDFSKSNADSILKAELESDRELSNTSFGTENLLQGVFFFTPLKGLVSQSYNRKTKHLGVDIVGNKNETIKATLDGHVIYSGWSENDGHVLIIDHRNGLTTCYKHNSSLMKKIGEKVQAGDPIAIIGNSGELSSGYHLHFELWHQGIPIDPQDFITFY